MRKRMQVVTVIDMFSRMYPGKEYEEAMTADQVEELDWHLLTAHVHFAEASRMAKNAKARLRRKRMTEK